MPLSPWGAVIVLLLPSFRPVPLPPRSRGTTTFNRNLAKQMTVKALPAALRALRGNPSNTAMGAGDIPAPPLTSFEPPEHLSETARILWVDLCELLAEVGLVTQLDKIALSQLCEAFADWCNAAQELAENTITVVKVKNGKRTYTQKPSRYQEITDAQGNTKLVPHPAMAVMSDADKRIRQWLVEFGLTPSSRAKWRVAPLDPESVPHVSEPMGLTSLSPQERRKLREVLES